MKSFLKFSAFILVTITTIAASAGQDLICENYTQTKETLISVKNLKNGLLELTIYRSVSGHAMKPQSVEVHQLQGSRGPVLAYGNKDQNQVLILDLKTKNSKGETTATYTNSIQKENLILICK